MNLISLAELVWYAPQWAPLALALAVILAAAVVWLYPPQVRMLGSPWRWMLPSLRVLALLALAVSILKPVATRARTAQEAGPVLILVDRSRSMSARDMAFLPAQIREGRAAARAAGEVVSLADGLGLLPAGVRREPVEAIDEGVHRVESLLNDLQQARGALDLAQRTGQGVQSARRRAQDAAEALLAAAADVSHQAKGSARLARLADLMARLRQAVQSTNNPRWFPQATASVRSALADVENLKSAADRNLYQRNDDVRAVCDELAGRSRFDLVDMVLTRPSSGLLDKFGTSFPLYGFSVAEDVAPLPLKAGGRPVAKLLTSPDGARSDLTGALRDVFDRFKGEPVQAAVLFSDGRQVGGDPTVASGLFASGVPIFTVLSGSRAGVADVSVSNVTVPAEAFAGETVTVRAEIRSSLFGGSSSDVVLTTDDGSTQTKHITLRDDQPVPVEFSVKLDKPGATKLTVAVPPHPDEASAENNSVQRWVKVLSQKIKVAVIAGPAVWDYQYVRNALSRTPWVQLDDQILDGDAPSLALTPDQILQEDLLILFDVPVAAVSESQWDAVHRLVSDGGGSVILVAGDRHLPSEYMANPMLRSLLPFRGSAAPAWRSWPGKEAAFHVAPAPGATGVDALRLEDIGDVQKRWAELPGFFRFLPISDLKPNTRALLVERDSQQPMLTEGRLGAGRVFFFGADETWRWRYKIGDAIQSRFWLQLARYAADESYAGHAGNVFLDASKLEAAPGDVVRLRAKVLDAAGHPSKAPVQAVEILREGKSVRTVQLSQVGLDGLGRYQGSIDDLAVGDYELRLADPASPGEAAVVPLHVAVNSEEEMANLAPDEQQLRRISESSGGAMLALDEVGSLPERIAAAQTGQGRLLERPLWDSYWLFLFVVACFATEWALRKRLGLV